MKQRILAALLCFVLAFGLLCAPLLSAEAVTQAELDSPALIGDLEPTGSQLCLVYASWYMARRRVALERDFDTACGTLLSGFRSSATVDGTIVRWEYDWNATTDLSLRFRHARLSYQYGSSETDIADLAHEDSELGRGIMAITHGVNISNGSLGGNKTCRE